MSVGALRLELRAGGKVLLLGDGTGYGVKDCTGLEAADYELHWQSGAQQDGAALAGRHTAQREIYIEAEALRPDPDGTARRELISFFDPKQTGELVVTLHGVCRCCAYEVASFAFTQRNLYRPPAFECTLVCPGAYFSDVMENAINMAGTRAQTACPIVLGPSPRCISALRFSDDRLTVDNTGDRATGLRVVMTAARGQVTDPVIRNYTTGEELLVKTTLQRGQTLVLSTRSGAKRVEIDGQSAMHMVGSGSRFFALRRGRNVIGYGAAAGSSNLDMYPWYSFEYLGI